MQYVHLFTGDLYVIGGKIKNPKDPGLADDTPTNVEMLVEEQDSWIKVADMTQPRWDAAAIVVKGNHEGETN